MKTLPRACGLALVLASAATLTPAGAARVASVAAAGGMAQVISIPMALDHNRTLVVAEMQAGDSTWRQVRLWVDTGSPDFILREDLGVKLPPAAIRLGGLAVDLHRIDARVATGGPWWAATHADANLPATVLQRYDVVFDYPGRRFEIGPPGSGPHRGVRIPAVVNPATGIVQVDATIAGRTVSLAIDLGASYTFLPDEQIVRMSRESPSLPGLEGAVGAANIWGAWPNEESWPLLRVPEIRIGPVRIAGVGVAGLPGMMFGPGADLATWYSRKTARPVAGFLGPNAFLGFRVEIDYAGGAVYLERQGPDAVHDMDLVGLTLRPVGGRWTVLGSARRRAAPAVDGVEAGDVLVAIDGRAMAGVTMGTVIDALRGIPGETRRLTLERKGRIITVEAAVRRLL